MIDIPADALIQKSKNNVSYVYFPSYYYDKDAVTHRKEKQKRLYIGKIVDGQFIPNQRYRDNPNLFRRDIEKRCNTPGNTSELPIQSVGATSLLNDLTTGRS